MTWRVAAKKRTKQLPGGIFGPKLDYHNTLTVRQSSRSGLVLPAFREEEISDAVFQEEQNSGVQRGVREERRRVKFEVKLFLVTCQW